MGFFSWKTSDTNKSILNRHCPHGPTPVFMILPDGRAIGDEYYDGYGVFGDHDFYVEVARFNMDPKEFAKLDENGQRNAGLDLAFDEEREGELRLPKFASKPMAWEDLPDSENCPYQGYFYGGEIEEAMMGGGQ